MRRAAPIAALLLLAACGGGDEAAPPQPQATPPTGPRLTVRAATIADWKQVRAEIASVRQAQVIARIPGVLATLNVREGDLVRKGQAIGRITDSQLGYQAGAYGAQAAAAQAQAAQADAELSRVRFLYEKGVYAKARLDQAQAAALSARAQIRAAQSQQAAVRAVAGQGLVVAPASGRVLRADVPAGAPVSPGTVIATITAGDTILRLDLPESLATMLHAGDRVRADIGTGGMTEGRITTLYPAVQAGQVRADVAIAGIDNRLIGRRIAAMVAAGSRQAILVPAGFVMRRFGIDTVTMLAPDGAAAQVPVQTAPADEPGMVELLSGVAAGDRLVGTAGK